MITHLSLFSGIGGLDLAAEWAGLTTVGQCELADYPHAVLCKHWPDVPKWRDIRTLTKESFYERTGLRTIDVISGGFPCQPFSVAGKQKGKDDDRYLWPELLRVIRELTPRWVVGENVPGILRIAAADIVADLEREGYNVVVFDFEAAAVGALHRRERIAFVGYSEDRRKQRELSGWNETWRSCSAGWWATEPDVGGGVDGLSAWLDGFGGLSNAAKTRAREILRDLWETYGAEEIWRQTRRFNGVSEKEVLFAYLCKYEDLCNRSGSEKEGRAISEESLRDLWIEIEAARASCRRRHYSQLAGEYSDTLLRLSHGSPSLMPQAWKNGSWESGLQRIAHGIKARADRLKCLGNAVVPWQFYPIFKAIAEVEAWSHFSRRF